MIELLTTIDSIVWGPAMIALLLGTHIYLTFRTGFIQRKLPQAIRMSVKGGEGGKGDISSFGALATALAATIGTGSIVGVATAILAGGPGAVFWMWIAGIFGIATKYVETYAAVKYRVRDKSGQMLGGAMFVWKRAFAKRDGTVPWWATLGAVAFAAFAVVATVGTGSAVQAAAISGIVTSSIPAIPAWVVALVIVVAVAAVIFGGVRSIARVCEWLVPIMAGAYALGCIVIICLNGAVLGDTLGLIIECAFTPHAAFGGAVGSGLMMALQYGCARGLFSNESGLGTAPIVAAAAKTKNPAEQALVSMTGAFWSTVVICALTGIVLVSTMIVEPQIGADILANPSVYTGAALASAAFADIPYVGTPVLVLGMCSFAYSTILGWSYYGNRCVAYLFGPKGIKPYQVIYVAVAFFGAIGVGDVVWTISDIGNALMAIPNIIVVLLLSGMIAKETKHFVYDDHLDEVADEPVPVVKGPQF
ncbi:amino acid carrier protein [Adlercreutzia sp. R25]|uniref:Amino acid carrier protein n=1 Tax=Adlercreutzia shanghongiae TaxID=3111773 RepID=A0ABU6J0X9_9ACTN|nr:MULTISPECIES: amino acid carrier protein [unclassified Adlercreutzia]MEC4273259.1 amino acid carrier protein [Adlercreutzia sp. R25]MEC4295492.1 amino acid carrier protein [Adlercreutzia sp. R22]